MSFFSVSQVSASDVPLRFSHDAHDFCVPALMSSAFDQGELGQS